MNDLGVAKSKNLDRSFFMFGLRQISRTNISKALLFCLVKFLVTVHSKDEFIIVSGSSR